MHTTYFIGAGASAQAIPIVKDSNIRFNFFIYYLEYLINKDIFNKKRDSIIDRVAVYKDLVNVASRHLSYDTYAKKLFLKQDWENFRYIKEFISMYYIFEHFEIIDFEEIYKKYFDINIKLFNKNEFKVLIEKGKTQIDKRYDAFLAGITEKISPSGYNLPEDISIVSWNYDMQFEFGMAEYSIINWNFDYMYNPINNEMYDKDNVLLKLNGSCGYNIKGDVINDEERIEDFEIKPLVNKNINIEKFLIDMITDYVSNNNYKYTSFINFAWQKNKISSKITDKAKKIMQKTASLVVIGYSFPLYNREIDKDLFSNIKIAENSKVYIQAISLEEFERIKSRIINISKRKINEKQIDYIPDVEQFYVPFELKDQRLKKRVGVR